MPYTDPVTGVETPEPIYWLNPPCGRFPIVALASRFTITPDGWRDTRPCDTCGLTHEYAPPKPAHVICVLKGYEPDEEPTP